MGALLGDTEQVRQGSWWHGEALVEHGDRGSAGQIEDRFAAGARCGARRAPQRRWCSAAFRWAWRATPNFARNRSATVSAEIRCPARVSSSASLRVGLGSAATAIPDHRARPARPTPTTPTAGPDLRRPAVLRTAPGRRIRVTGAAPDPPRPSRPPPSAGSSPPPWPPPRSRYAPATAPPIPGTTAASARPDAATSREPRRHRLLDLHRNGHTTM